LIKEKNDRRSSIDDRRRESRYVTRRLRRLDNFSAARRELNWYYDARIIRPLGLPCILLWSYRIPFGVALRTEILV